MPEQPNDADSSPQADDHPRIALEKRTLRAMVSIYCRAHRDSNGGLCRDCREVLEYALARLDRCPFAGGKTTCEQCPIHCYKPEMRARVKQVMRVAGPRMAYRHPILALRHRWQSLKKPRRET